MFISVNPPDIVYVLFLTISSLFSVYNGCSIKSGFVVSPSTS